MSDATFESQDSQAAWKALGNHMRRNRMWLLMMFVALALYMAAQSWARVRRDGWDAGTLASNVALTSSTPASEPPASPVPASPPPASLSQKSAAAGREAVAAPPPKQSPVGQVGHTSRKSDSQNALRNGLNQLLENRLGQADRGVPKASAPSLVGNQENVRTARDSKSQAPLPPPGGISAFGESVGEWVGDWQRRGEDSRGEGIRLAARALAKYARLPARNVEAQTETVQPEVVPAPRKVETAEIPVPQPSRATAESTSGDGPQFSTAEHAGLSIRNPSRTGGAVRYLVNGQDHTLRPGEAQELPAGQWLIEFHRGGEHGDTAYTLAKGSYRFEITANGWELLSGQ